MSSEKEMSNLTSSTSEINFCLIFCFKFLCNCRHYSTNLIDGNSELLTVPYGEKEKVSDSDNSTLSHRWKFQSEEILIARG